MEEETIAKYGSLYSTLRVNERSPRGLLSQPAVFLLQRVLMTFLFVMIPFIFNKNVPWV